MSASAMPVYERQGAAGRVGGRDARVRSASDVPPCTADLAHSTAQSKGLGGTLVFHQNAAPPRSSAASSSLSNGPLLPGRDLLAMKGKPRSSARSRGKRP